MASRGPALTVDCIILLGGKVLLIRRRNPPTGWALPGGFVDYGESVEDAVRREMREETGLELAHLRQFRVYSAPDRDPRGHTVSVVFVAEGVGRPEPGDDAERVRLIDLTETPESGATFGAERETIVFDHAQILRDFRQSNAGS